MFKVGNNYGKFSKRGKAVDSEIKSKIKDLANNIIEDINIKEMSRTQKINLLKACLPYLIAREISTLSEIADNIGVEAKPPQVIVFGNREELDEYNNMSSEEQDKMCQDAPSFFNSKL